MTSRSWVPGPVSVALGTAGIVEASGIVEDNQWILDLLGHDAFFPFFVGQLEIGSANFIANLDPGDEGKLIKLSDEFFIRNRFQVDLRVDLRELPDCAVRDPHGACANGDSRGRSVVE